MDDEIKTFFKFGLQSFKLVSSINVANKAVRYQIWSVKCLKEGQRTYLKSLNTKGAINICNEESDTMDVMVEGDRVMQIGKLLRDRDIRYDVTSTVASGLRKKSPIPTSRSRPMSPISNSFNKRTLDWKDFYPLNVIYNALDNLEVLFPSICTVSSIGQSVEGRDIKMLKISNSDARNTGVWVDGGIHAREWISVSVVSYMADQFAKNFYTLPTYITNKDWCFVPVLNPDGYHHTHFIDRMWRKNRARVGGSVYGVDLNRNFGFNWGRSSPETYEDPNHMNFRGLAAFSEPETKALKDYILYSNIPFKIFLTFHAYSEVISFPWCFTSDPCPDYVNLLEGATAMAKAIYNANKRMYKVGNFKDVMYCATGTSIDWSYGVARIPFSYLVELRSRQHKFILPREEILDCCKEVTRGVQALAEFVDSKKCVNCKVVYKTCR